MGCLGYASYVVTDSRLFAGHNPGSSVWRHVDAPLLEMT